MGEHHWVVLGFGFGIVSILFMSLLVGINSLFWMYGDLGCVCERFQVCVSF